MSNQVAPELGEGQTKTEQNTANVDGTQADVLAHIEGIRKRQKEKEQESTQPKGDMASLIVFTFLVGFGNMQAGFAIAGNNQVAPVIKIKFGWDESEGTLYNTMISSSAIIGVVLGALAGGRFIQYGRRNCLIIFNCISAVALIGTQFLSLPSICAGRIVFGFCCGVLQVAGVKMLEETVPIQNQSAFGTATNTLLAFGIMVAIVLAVGLPDGDDKQGMKDDQFYRVIYGFPWLFQALTIIMCLTCYKHDSIVFLIQQGNDEDALKTIQKVYSKDEDPQRVLDVVKMQSSTTRRKDSTTGKSAADDEDEHISITTAMCHPRYRNATWVAFLLCFFQQQTGLDGIMIYSNTIFAEMKKRGSISFSAKVGSYIVGCWSLLVAVVSPALVRRFKRRTLLVWGQTSMAISLMAVAVFYIYKKDILTIVGINWFIMSFQLSQGPIAWMYAGEIASDTGLGLAILALYASLLEKAITMEFMVHSKAFGPQGMFFFLGGVTTIGAFFIFFVVKETAGLEDKQKKLLYTPKEWIPEDDILGDVELEAQEKSNQPIKLQHIGKQRSFQDQRKLEEASRQGSQQLGSTDLKGQQALEIQELAANGK